MTLHLTDDQKRAVWDVLVDTCGAHSRLWPDFALHFPACREFRFQGSLGFGGKVYADSRRVWVGNYREDETTERIAAMRQANEALSGILTPTRTETR